MYFYNFAIFFPFEGCDPSFLFPKNMLCEKFGWNCPSGSGKQDENVKSLQTDRQQTDRHTDDGTTGGQKSSLKLSAQVS